MPFNQNFFNDVMGHVNASDENIGGGGEVEKKAANIPSRDKITDNVDVRDLITGLVGGGYTDFTNPDVRHNFARLTDLLGRDQAEKMMIHIFQFNKRPEIKSSNAEYRVSNFYDVGSNNDTVNKIIQTSKNLGTGPLPGRRTSPDILNKQASGRDTSTTPSTTSSQSKKVEDLVDQSIKPSNL